MEVREEREVGVDQEHIDLINSLNSEKLAGFNDIMDHIMNKKTKSSFSMLQEALGRHTCSRHCLLRCVRWVR